LKPFSFDDSELERFRACQRKLIESNHLVLAAAADRCRRLTLLKDQSDPVAFLSRNISVSCPNDGYLIDVSFSVRTQHTDQLAEILNHVVQEYIQHISALEWHHEEGLIKEYLNLEFDLHKRLNDLEMELISLESKETLTPQEQQQLRSTERLLSLVERLYEHVQWKKMVHGFERRLSDQFGRMTVLSPPFVEPGTTLWGRLFGG